MGAWDVCLAAGSGAGPGSGGGVGRIASVFTKIVSGMSGLGDAEIGAAGVAGLLNAPGLTTRTINAASNAEAATIFINVVIHV
jgi:hypothetical protein